MGTFTKPASEFAKIPIVKSQMLSAAAAVGREAAQEFENEIEARLDSNRGEPSYGEPGAELVFDSPLETVFWVWWRAAQKIDMFCDHNMILRRHVEATAGDERYVIDFVLVPSLTANSQYMVDLWPLIGIELDGHAFHEKTLEQVTYRNQRDRALQQAGWHLFHYSFAEFTDQPERCMWEVVEFARATYWQVIRTHEGSRQE